MRLAPRTRLALAAAAFCLAAPAPAVAATKTFNYTGAIQSWPVPAGVTQAAFDLYGAQGQGNCTGLAQGAHVHGAIALTPGETLRVLVGGTAGFNGGGAGNNRGGGGSDVRRGPGFGLADRLLVAGGGGGRGDGNTACPSPNGRGGASGEGGQMGNGSGGGASGGGGGGAGTDTTGGPGGTAGSGGVGGLANGTVGGAGQPGGGGEGGPGIVVTGGGGGGGYYGGGGGGSGGISSDGSTAGGGGGGGGSSFTGVATGASVTDGLRAGNGVVVITYTAPPPSGGSGGSGGGVGTGGGFATDLIKPNLGSLSLSPRAFPAAGRGSSIARKRGTRVSFRLSEPAKVRFRVKRARPGRKVGRRCVKPKRKNRRRRRCTRYVRVRGSFSFDGVAGDNSFRFTGRLRGRKLRRGRYRLTGGPVDAAGNKGKTVTRRFRIIRP